MANDDDGNDNVGGGSEGEESIHDDALEPEDVRKFLASFDVGAHAEEISRLLATEKNNDAAGNDYQ